MQECFVGIDIGASSGRHIAGWVENQKIHLQEVYRFENNLLHKNGHLCWDLEKLTYHVIEGLAQCHKAGYQPKSIGVDTWAVDFVLLDEAGNPLGDAVAYRDGRTQGIPEQVEQVIPFEELYARTGIQFQPFNTIYQLVALQKEHPEQMEKAKTFLMIPDYLNYRLTGVAYNEYTNASTTALVYATTRQWDDALIEKLNLPREIFQTIQMPGKQMGLLSQEVSEYVGFCCPVVLPATHDTGSAFLAVPDRDEHTVVLSSGTWSLLGVQRQNPVLSEESRKANFTNEGGYGATVRCLKNIMGLWMIQSIRREVGKNTGTLPSFPQLIEQAKNAAEFSGVVDVNDNRFLAPESMIEEVKQACRETGQPVPSTTGEVMQCVYRSLASSYAEAVKQLEFITKSTYTKVSIVGGGSQDMYLNQMTATATGLPVFAGPTEGTALGNILVQMVHAGVFADFAAAHQAMKQSFDIKEVQP